MKLTALVSEGSYRHTIGPVAVTIFVLETDPTLGALGFAGAIAVTAVAGTLPHTNTNGWVESE